MNLTQFYTELKNTMGALYRIEYSMLLHLDTIVHSIVVFLLFLLSRYIFDVITPFSLVDVLSKRDNKALSISFSSFMLGLSCVIGGVYANSATHVAALESSRPLEIAQLIDQVLDTLTWGTLGILLLIFSQIINNYFILSKFHNYDEIIKNENIAAATVEGASYIASGIILYGVMQGSSQFLLVDIILTIIYFFFGQLALVLFSKCFIHILLKKEQFYKCIVAKNTAVALYFSANMIAFSLLLSSYFSEFDSIWGVIIMIPIAMLLFLMIFIFIDKVFLKKVKIQKELFIDNNWGFALVMGFLTIGLVSILII